MSRKNTSRNNVRLAAALLLALPAAAHTAPAPASKCDSTLTRLLAAPAAPSDWSSVIAHLTGPLRPGQLTQLTALKGDVTRRLPLIQSLALRVPTENLARLAALPFVSHLSCDGVVKKCDEFTADASGATAAYQWGGLTGQGVTVAVVDSGITPEADLTAGASQSGASRIVASVNFNNDGYGQIPCGHGSHVAGIIAGNGAASAGPNDFRTFYGVARGANLVGVRVLDETGSGDVATVIAGIQWVVQNGRAYNIRVMNLSLGHPVGESYANDPLCQAVEAAWKAGIVVVCAAGNGGRLNAAQTAGAGNEGWGTAYGSVQSPANDPYVITVGAMKGGSYAADGAYLVGGRGGDRIATYSSRGPSCLDLTLKPDLVAPGNQVISLEAPGSYLFNEAAGTNDIPLSTYQSVPASMAASPSYAYFRLSGTSMASPVVAGAAALLLQRDPALSPDTVKARLMASADKWAFPGAAADACTFGAGYLDIPAALGCTATVPAGRYALSPALTMNGSGAVSISTAVIGSRSVWGSGALTDLRSVWGSSAVSGIAHSTLAETGPAMSALRSVWGSAGAFTSSASAVDLSSIAINGEK